MTNARRRLLTCFKEELEKQPFEKGMRRTIIGPMSMVFKHCENENQILDGMEELSKDLRELGMSLCSYPKHPELLCAGQYTEEAAKRFKSGILVVKGQENVHD